MRPAPTWRVLEALLAGAALWALPVAANADDLPIRKAGLWEMKMTVAQLPAMTMQQCTDETTDRQMSSTSSPMQEMCAKNDIRKTADGYAIDAVCTTSGMQMTSHTDITGDFSSGYTMKIATKMDGAPKGGPKAMPHDGSMTIEAKWVGACKADQKPGDVVMPGGMKMNIKDMQAMKGMMKKP